MRTTLTLDDSLMKQLRDRAHREQRSLKSVLNDVVRAGLSAKGRPGSAGHRFTVAAEHRGFQPGIDPGKLNQLVDELEVEDFARRLQRDAR